DRTGDIARDFARRDPRVIYVRNATNIGANRNYNRAMSLARGDYFKLGDDDGAPLRYDARSNRYVDQSGGTSIEPPDPNYGTDDDPVRRFHTVLRHAT